MAGVDQEGPIDPFEASRSAYHSAVRVILAGIAITVPLVVTLYVLRIVFRFVRRSLQPVVDLLDVIGVIGFFERNVLVGILIDVGLYDNVVGFFSELVAVLTLVAIVLGIGLLATHPRGERVVGYVDVAIATIPGIGTVYKSFRRMGDVMIDSDVDNFEQVHLVELFADDAYVIGFEVGHSPDRIQEAADREDVVTMFVPFAPNPVTGGFLTYVSEDRLAEVDMSVEEGIRNVITSGVAGQGSDLGSVDVSFQDVQEVLHGWDSDGVGEEAQSEESRAGQD